MSTPLAIIIADVHYNVSTLELADYSMRQALLKAEELNIPLIVAGDLHDTKANLRGECIKGMINLFKTANTRCIVIVGNHCRLNEKSREHSLEFLRPYVEIVDSPKWDPEMELWMLPYFSELQELKQVLDVIPSGSKIIAHQGIREAWKGHYVHDESAAPAEWFANFRTISGHYHRSQTINCRNGRRLGKNETGAFSYVGNPYTLTFAEAEDGQKGFQILHTDGTLKLEPTDLRKHVVVNATTDSINSLSVKVNPDDIIWLKVSGPQSQLDFLSQNKASFGEKLFGRNDFKLDLIPTDSNNPIAAKSTDTPHELLDKLVDALNETDEQKSYIKNLVKELIK